KGALPFISVTLNESSQTITLSASANTFADKAPGLFHNTIRLGASNYFLDQAIGAKGKFSANSGYRSTAFVVSGSNIKVGKPGKDSATISMLLGDPNFVFPAASGARTVRILVTNVLNQVVIDKDLSAIVTSNAGKLKSGKD